MGFFEKLGAAAKAVTSDIAQASVPFSSWGGQGYSSYGGSNNWSGSPGSVHDYASEAGNLLENGIVAACVDAIAQALASTPPILQRLEGKDWNTIPSHPLIDLLMTPNDQYANSQLWMATTAAECTSGNGYWRGVWNRSRTQLVQLWWEGMAAPRWDRDTFISGYTVWVDGKPYYLQSAGDQANPRNRDGDCIIHFRYALHPQNPRWGWTPLTTSTRQIAGDNGVASYHSSLMRNSSTASMVVVPKEGAATPSPGQLEKLVDSIERKLRGEGAGRVAGTSLPVDIYKMGFSPDEMAITEILGYYERRVCASLKVHPMVLGLGAGDDFKTYSNFQECIKDFWMRTVIPRQERRGDELETQLFPLFDLDRNEYRIEWDRSGVAALQENEDALYKRLEGATGKPFITPNEARAKVHLPPKEGGDDLPQPAAPPGVAPEGSNPDGADSVAQKALLRFLKIIDANGMSHGDDGKFDGGTGGSSAYHEAKTKAIEHLKEYTKNDKAEALYVFDRKTGEKLDFKEGESDNVRSSADISGRSSVAAMHSHSNSVPFGEEDWVAFMGHENLHESVVVTTGSMYTIQKPTGHKVEQASADRAGMYLLGHVNLEQRKRKLWDTKFIDLDEKNQREILHVANVEIAKRFGVTFKEEPVP